MVSEDLRNMVDSTAGTEKPEISLKCFIVSKTEEVLKRNERCKKDTGASLRGS